MLVIAYCTWNRTCNIKSTEISNSETYTVIRMVIRFIWLMSDWGYEMTHTYVNRTWRNMKEGEWEGARKQNMFNTWPLCPSLSRFKTLYNSSVAWRAHSLASASFINRASPTSFRWTSSIREVFAVFSLATSWRSSSTCRKGEIMSTYTLHWFNMEPLAFKKESCDKVFPWAVAHKQQNTYSSFGELLKPMRQLQTPYLSQAILKSRRGNRSIGQLRPTLSLETITQAWTIKRISVRTWFC